MYGENFSYLLKYGLVLCVTLWLKATANFDTNAAQNASRQISFIRTNTSSLLPYQPERLMDLGWSNIPRLTTCAYTTVTKFNNSRGFIYNTENKSCTPLAWSLESQNASIGSSGGASEGDEGGQLYKLLVHCPEDFQLYEVGDGSQACLKHSSIGKTYQEATSTCNGWGGHLASVKTVAKLELVRVLAAGQYMWIGLDDLVQEGNFVWQIDRTSITVDQLNALFSPGEPSGGEHCVHYWTRTEKLNDLPCRNSLTFLCEILLI